MKGLWVHKEFHLHKDASRTDGDEGTAVIVVKVVTGPLVRQSASCIFCTPAQRISTRSGCVPIHVGEQQAGKIPFEATLLSRCPIDGTSDRLMESSNGRLGRGTHIEKGMKNREKEDKWSWENS